MRAVLATSLLAPRGLLADTDAGSGAWRSVPLRIRLADSGRAPMAAVWHSCCTGDMTMAMLVEPTERFGIATYHDGGRSVPILQNFPTAVQATPDSCWACASRMINNYYQARGESGANPVYASDQALATAWAAVTGDPANANIDVQQSAAAALEDLGFVNNIDSAAIPTQAEITDAIHDGQPLLAIVGDAPPAPDPNPNYQNGHWVVIVGISADQANTQVFDPDDGQVHIVAYNAATYTAGSYWQNCSYVDAQ